MESKVFKDGLDPLDHFGVQVEGAELGVCVMGCRGWLGFGWQMNGNAKKYK